MEKNQYTVVISSCDKYEDLWNPFFKVLKAEWPELSEKRIPIVLNTEKKCYSYEGLNLRTVKPCANQELSWTERLKTVLESIETDYIIHLLDDFFLTQKVQQNQIDKCLEWMCANNKISAFYFNGTTASRSIDDGKYPGFVRRSLIAPYKLNCQAAIWNREKLISYLRKKESPWEWETMGNWRTYKHPFHYFYSAMPGTEKAFVYAYKDKQSGIYHGKWVVSTVEPVFKKHDIRIDYSIRGTASKSDFAPEKKKEDAPKWKQQIWFLRPLYCESKSIVLKFTKFLVHIDHFL